MACHDPPLQAIQMILAITVLDAGQNGVGVVSVIRAGPVRMTGVRRQDGELVVQPCLRHGQPSLVPALLVDGEQRLTVLDPVDDVHRNVPPALLSGGVHYPEGLSDSIGVGRRAGGEAVDGRVLLPGRPGPRQR